ncbi:hypothetical protein B0H14DRAFT_2216215, partial [Mycena olivaceomarginata]
YFFAIAGTGSVEGSVKWWLRGHHPTTVATDIELNPSRAGGGFWYSHIDWMLVKHCRKPRVADMSDLPKN